MAHPLSIRGVYNALRWPEPRDFLFSTKAFFAAAVALLIGFSQDLQNPYWAVLTVYVVLMPPESGAMRSKALFRLIGTVTGGMLALALTAKFGDQLGVLITVIISVIGISMFLRQIDRTPMNYLWVAVGVTVGVIGLTNLMQPLEMFSYATARMGEISLGILVIAAIDSLISPRALTPDFLQTLSTWRDHTRIWVVEALDHSSPQEPDEKHREKFLGQLRGLTKAVGVIDAKSVQLPFDIVPFAPRKRDLNLVRRQVIALIADLTALGTWTRSLRHIQLERPQLEAALAAVSAWVSDSKDLPTIEMTDYSARGDALIVTLEGLRASLNPNDRHALLERGMATRLIAFVRDWSDLGIAMDAVANGRRLPSRLRQIARCARPVRSIDYTVAILDVVPLVISMTVTTTIWYLTAWQSGSAALLFSFVGCIFFVGQRLVLPAALGLIAWITVPFVFVFTYDYAILPRVSDFPVLIAVLGVAILPLGLLMTMSLAGMLMCVFIFAFLGLQDAYTADFNQSLLTLVASATGLFIATGCMYLFDYDRAKVQSRRLVRAVRFDILDIARSRRLPSRERLLSLTIDRLALYIPAAEQASAGKHLPRLGMLDDLRIGINLLQLRQLAPQVTPVIRDAIETLRTQISVAFQRQLRELPADNALLECVDAITALPALTAEPQVGELREALLGIRLAIVQDGDPYPENVPRHDA